MRTGLLQPSNSNFVGITRRKFAAIGYRFPLSPVFGQWNKLLERLNIRKPPAEFQDVCLKTFCAVRARLRLEDFNGEGQAICCARGFHYESWFSFPASQVSESEGGTGSGSFLVFCCPTSLDFLFFSMLCLSRSRQESSRLARGWARVRRVLVLKRTLHMFKLQAADMTKHGLEVWLLWTRVWCESLCATFFCIDCVVLLAFLEQTLSMVWRKMDWGRDYGLPTNAFYSKQLPRKNANKMLIVEYQSKRISKSPA